MPTGCTACPPSANGSPAAGRNCWRRPTWWRRCRCIGPGCSAAASTSRPCWPRPRLRPGRRALPLPRASPPELLVRRRRTRSQGHLSRLQRAENVRGAFAVKPGVAVAGKRILLVDDVLTTGATIEACARVLKRAGATEVDVLTLARAMRLPGGAAP
ncbi:MAG TPA: phosphoribosyltransferase family protein [Aliidongia sp.]|uniref:ComF family protein n=1 Tax=Aliidongia sp. TaxID=1914230 RepID=UPI002DDCE25E|nr:phosphoribosyltransferase family protein [Aliidongia sp.]HEV2675179.1 phosphoribosyltransferase family protein [Aliidongia sp.]